MNTAIGMAWMGCVGLGGLIVSYLSDTYVQAQLSWSCSSVIDLTKFCIVYFTYRFIGRKPVAVFLGIGASIFGTIKAFSVTYSMYMVLTCALGLVIGSAFTSCCCLSKCFVIETVRVCPLSHLPCPPHGITPMLAYSYISR